MQRVSCCVLVIDIATRWLLWAESIIWLLCHSLGVRKTNFSGISPANPNPSEIWYTYRNQGATTFRKFWERSAKWEQNWRFRRLLRRRFLCAINQIRFYFANFPTIDFHQIWPRRLNPYPLEIARDFRKKFSLCVICLLPKTSKLMVVQQVGLLASLQLAGRIVNECCSVQYLALFNGRLYLPNEHAAV